MNDLKIIKQITGMVTLKEIERVLTEFHKDSGLMVDFEGFMAHTLDRFALATFLENGAWDLWLCEENGKIKAYFLCSVDKAMDNKFCYMVHQGWLSKELRGNGLQHTWWEQLKERAKEKFCKQMIIYSVRNYEAYKRLLGENLTPYSEMLHLKLEV
jgi:hypothetical protein